MPIYDMYPYSNLHELNLDWVLKKVKELEVLVSQAVGQDVASTIIFANPIQWDITSDYGRYNLVLDTNYDAYLSTRAVPAGTLLSDTVYWQPVGNFAQIVELVLDNLAPNQGINVIAQTTYNVGDLLVLNDTLYEATSIINIGATINDPANVSPVTLDSLIKALKNSISTNTNDISLINSDITNINNDILNINSQLSGVKPQIRIKHSFMYYIDGVNGDDNNTGLSNTAAFKTIDKFLSMSDQYADIRAYIISAGTYVATLGDNFAGLSVHIKATVGGVTVQLPTAADNTASIYGAHWNLQGPDASNKLTITAPPSVGVTYGRIYSDDSNWTLKYVRFPDNQLALYGSMATITECEFIHIHAEESILTLVGLKILNADPDITPLEFTSCRVNVTGTWSSTNLSATGTKPYLNLIGSWIFIGSMFLSNTTNKYTLSIKGRYSQVTISTTRKTNLAGYTQNGDDILTSDGNLIFTY